MFGSCLRAVPWDGGSSRRVQFLRTLTLTSLLSITTALSAQAQEVLTLADAVRLVSDDQPQLSALRAQEEAALESARAERELPDPQLGLGFQNLPVTGDEALRFDRDDMTMVTIGVMQDVVPRAKREAAAAREEAEARRFSAERLLSARTIQRDVALAWLEAFEAQQQAASLRQMLAEMTAEREVSAAKIASGGGGASGVLALDVELSDGRDQLIEAERGEARARAMLSRLNGEAALRPLPDVLPSAMGERVDLTNAARVLDTHPALEAAEQAVEAALRGVDRARADRKPDWGWQLMYGQRQDDRSDMVSFQVSVGLPLNQGDRQNRRIAQRLAEASAARGEMVDRRRMLEAEFESVRADLIASAKRLREHAEYRVPAARARLETAQAAYAGGSGTLMEVWQARRAWIEAQLHHEMILANRARALTRLAWLTGETEVLP